jgi:hypothetical protein
MIILCFLWVLPAFKVNAQGWYYPEKTFSGFASYMLKEFGVSCTAIPGFKDMGKYPEIFIIKKSNNTASMYAPVMNAKDECILMYPAMPIYITIEDAKSGFVAEQMNKILHKTGEEVIKEFPPLDELEKRRKNSNKRFPKGMIRNELQAMLGMPNVYTVKERQKIDTVDFDRYVTTYAGKEVREKYNADTLYIYEVVLEKPYLDKYQYCTGMVITKENRASFFFKWFFTSNGKKKEQEYLKMLDRNIWYTDRTLLD